jgi:hypothetical protein
MLSVLCALLSLHAYLPCDSRSVTPITDTADFSIAGPTDVVIKEPGADATKNVKALVVALLSQYNDTDICSSDDSSIDISCSLLQVIY